LTFANFFPVLALNDTTNTWSFTAATASDFTYDSNLVTIDNNGAHPVSGVNKITNPAFTSDNSFWSVAANPPSGWVEVPANSDYFDGGGLGYQGNFLAMQYEAKYDCTGDGDGDTAAKGYFKSGRSCRKKRTERKNAKILKNILCTIT
jgi:hypothetical protein